jgi:3-dehydroquinate synthetase
MRAAAALSVAAGQCDERDAERQDALLRRFGLLAPTSGDRTSIDAVLSAISRDKKSRGGEMHWVLLCGIGHAEPDQRVDEQVVRTALGATLP